MVVTPVLRIIRFRPRSVEFDDALRHRLIPALRAQPGLIDVVAGRHGTDELGQRIVTSVWSSVAAADTRQGPEGSIDELAGFLDVDEVRSERLSVRVQFRNPRPGTARLLRVFRGQVRGGEMDRYVEEAEAGALADTAAGHGPITLHLAVVAPQLDRFVTVSTWPDWSTIEAATGGDIHQPLATRHPERIVASDVTHYEVIDG